MSKPGVGCTRCQEGHGLDLWRTDPLLQSRLQASLGEERLIELEPRFAALGRDAGGRLTELAHIADHQGPVVEQFDRLGERIDQVVYHPAYHELEEAAYGRHELVALKYDPAFLADHGDVRHLVGFALGYLFAQGEAGLYCPVCMTDGVARVLSLHGSEEQRSQWIPRLASRDLGTLCQGAMFLTEIQGGSDVGQVACEALSDGDQWRLTGSKWFSSNADAELILALARPQGAGPGTRGLGLFLLPRELPDGSRNGIVIDRLKDKLGVRSMPTGELRLEGARAQQVGSIDHGFAYMTDMLNLSRLYNAITSVAVGRRALVEGVLYTSGREAFGRRVTDFPLVGDLVARLSAELEAATALVFRAVAALDAVDSRQDPDEEKVLRLLTPLIKYRTGRLAVTLARHAVEMHGGNGYVETFITTRLLRDANVLPIWEGTTHILILDSLRAIAREGVLGPFMATVEADLGAAAGQERLAPLARQVAAFAAPLEGALARLSEGKPALQAGAMSVTDRLYRVASAARLLAEAARDLAAGRTRRADLADRYLADRFAGSPEIPLGEAPLLDPLALLG